MQKTLRKGLSIGTILLFFLTSITSTVIGITPYIKNESSISANYNFWKHENVHHYNITDSYTLYATERQNFGTAYSYNNFSIIPTGDSEYDPWLVWIDDSTGNSDSLKFEDVPYSDHFGCFLQIDTDGYVWVSRGGYAHVVPFDLYKSNVPLSTSDYTGYIKKLDNFWTAVGATNPNVVILNDKVNLFFRNGANDISTTEYQQLQYNKNDFSTQLINREICLSGLYQGTPIVPCYGWSRVDPRYNVGFLSFSFKHYSPELWGSFPFIGLTNEGSTLFKGDDSVYSIPLSYQSNIDIPLDNIYENIFSRTHGVNSGITPGGYNYHIAFVEIDSVKNARMFLYDDAQWNIVWSDNITGITGFAVGATKDYTVLLYGFDNEIFIMTSDDDCQTWIGPTKIVEAMNIVSGIAFAQPVFDYTDNKIRFFYSEHNSDMYYQPHAKYQFIKFDASKFHQYAPEPPVITGPTSGIAGENIEYTFTSYDIEDDDIFYYIDWGDDTNTGWLGPYDSGEQITLFNTWNEGGTYIISAKAKDMQGAESNWNQHEVFINEVPEVPNIIGPTTGIAGESYDYTFVGFDPEDEEIFYYIDWGDDTNTGWIGPYASGEQITLPYTWIQKDTYEIRCKIKDVHDAESDWGVLEITMPLNQQIHNINFGFSLIQKILELLPNIFSYLQFLLSK